MRDFLHIERVIYDPANYFFRVTITALKLKCSPKYRPGFIKRLKTVRAFLKLSRRHVKNGASRRPYLKMFLTVLFRNPGAIESAINLSAMFIHFQKQSQFIIEYLNYEIEAYESCLLAEKSGMQIIDHYVAKKELHLEELV